MFDIIGAHASFTDLHVYNLSRDNACFLCTEFDAYFAEICTIGNMSCKNACTQNLSFTNKLNTIPVQTFLYIKNIMSDAQQQLNTMNLSVYNVSVLLDTTNKNLYNVSHLLGTTKCELV